MVFGYSGNKRCSARNSLYSTWGRLSTQNAQVTTGSQADKYIYHSGLTGNNSLSSSKIWSRNGSLTRRKKFWHIKLGKHEILKQLPLLQKDFNTSTCRAEALAFVHISECLLERVSEQGLIWPLPTCFQFCNKAPQEEQPVPDHRVQLQQSDTRAVLIISSRALSQTHSVDRPNSLNHSPNI